MPPNPKPNLQVPKSREALVVDQPTRQRPSSVTIASKKYLPGPVELFYCQ